jgi:hypothetical protein
VEAQQGIAKRKKKVRFLYALRDDSVADVAASTLGSTSRGVFGTPRDVGVLLVHRGSASARSDVADGKLTDRSPFLSSHGVLHRIDTRSQELDFDLNS